MARSGGTSGTRGRAAWAAVVLLSTLPFVAVQAGRAAAAVPEPQFQPYVTYPTSFSPESIAVADFTGDGRKDVAFTSQWQPNADVAYDVFLLTQQADGSFKETTRIDMPAHSRVTTAAAGDLDGDGRADLATPLDTGIAVLFQRNGTLAPPTIVPATGVDQVEIADVDGDGVTDLLGAGTGGVSWLRGLGAGTFGPPRPITTVEMRIAVGHFNRDNLLDIVGTGGSTLYVFRQQADGTFTSTQTRSFTAPDLAVGDLNGDGLDDVAITNASNRPTASIAVWPQRADGSLGPAVVTPTYDIPTPLKIADVNGDGRKDVVTLHNGWWEDGYLLQDTDGTLTPERLLDVPYDNERAGQLAVVDVTGDGRPDIVYAGGGTLVVIRNSPALPPTTTTSTTSVTPTTKPGGSTTTTTTPPPPAPGDETTSWQIDAAHTGALSGGAERPPLAKRWTRDLGGLVASPLIAGGRVFAIAATGNGSTGSTLYALDAATGADLWGPLDLGTSAFLAYGDGQLFVLNRDGLLRSFDPATGRQRWIVLSRPSQAPPVYRDGVLYVDGESSPTAELFALSPADGHILWDHPHASPLSAPAAGDGLVGTASECIDSGWTAGGQILWSHFRCEGGDRDLTPVLAGGLLWARNQSQSLPTASDARTGAPVVTFSADAAPAFDADRGYFLESGRLEARLPRTQEVLWSFTGDGQLTAAPIVVNGYVYAGSASGRLWALDAATGAVAWSGDAGAPVLASGERDFRPLFTGLAAGQGIVAVPATNLLVAYANTAAPPTGATAAKPSPAPARPAVTVASTDETTNVRIDATHQGTTVGGPEQPPLRQRWVRDVGYMADYSILAAGRVFVAAGPMLYALDPLTGADVWGPIVLGSEQAPYSNVSYGDGKVFAAFREGPLRAFDATTGKELWSKAPTEYGEEDFSAPVVYDKGLVYAVTSQGVVRALSATTGEMVWKGFAGVGAATPTVSGDLVVVPTCGAGARAFAPTTGALLWDVESGCIGVGNDSSAISAGELWTSVDGRAPLVRDATSGKLLAGSSGGPAAFDDQRVYALEGTALRARDRTTGFTLWTFPGDGHLATAPVDVNGTVYVASTSGKIWGLDPVSGATVWAGDLGLTIPTLRSFGGSTAKIAAGQGLVTVPASTSLVAFEPVPAAGTYHPVDPARILDTRAGVGAPVAKVGPGGTLSLQVTGRGGVPAAGVSAVAVNLTVTNPSAPSYLTAWPAGYARPLASNLNYLPAQTIPNMVVVKVGGGGKVNLFNQNGTVDVVADVAGWYGLDGATDGARYQTVDPARILDTRAGVGAPVGKVGQGGTLSLQVTGRAGLPAAGVSAVALNVTVTNPTAASYLTAWPTGRSRPLASNLNYLPAETIPNLVVVKVGDGGRVDFFNQLGTVDVVVDVAGWYGPDGAADGARYTSLAPARILDTRIGVGAPVAKVGQGGSLSLQVTGRGGIPATGVSAVALNVTVTNPSAASYLTAWPTGRPRPLASNLNYRPAETIPNLVVVKVGDGGRVDLFNQLGTVDVVVDVAGWFGA